jgi:hypothetical protein
LGCRHETVSPFFQPTAHRKDSRQFYRTLARAELADVA